MLRDFVFDESWGAELLFGLLYVLQAVYAGWWRWCCNTVDGTNVARAFKGIYKDWKDLWDFTRFYNVFL